jgi:formiminotetrahydrofolate cyclodeaminase
MLALSAALLRMVAEYTPDDPRAIACAARLVDVRLTALGAAEADGVSSAELGAALRVAADDPARDDRVRDAAIRAARSSGALGGVGVGMLDELRLLREIGNPHLAADLAVAGEALSAGIAGASINLRANLRLAGAHGGAGGARGELEADVERMRAARDVASAIADQVAARYDDR